MSLGAGRAVSYAEVGASNPHDLMRVMEGHFIRDCAEMAARASL